VATLRRSRPLVPRLLTAAVVLGAACSAGAAPILDPAHLSERQLANGLHAIVKQEPGWGLVAVSVYVRSGALYEPREAPGVAHMMEHLLFRQSAEQGGESLAARIEGMGAYFNAATNLDFTSVDVVVGSDAFADVLPLLAKTVLEAPIEPADLEREKRVVVAELEERGSQVEQRLRDLTWATAFTTHPYRQPVAGTPADIEALTPEAVQAYYRRLFTPGNMAVIATGEVGAEEAMAQIEAAFGRYAAGGGPPPAPAPEPPQTEIRTKTVEDAGAGLTLFAYAFHAPGIAKKRDVCAMDLIWTLLGEGPTSVFGTVLVGERQLLQGYVLDFTTRRDDGLFVAICSAEPQKAEAAQAAALEEIRRLAATPVADTALARAKKLLRNSYAFTNETYRGQVGGLGFYEMIDTYTFAIEYLDRVNAITPADLQEVARTYLAGDNYSRVVIQRRGGPEQ